MIILRDPQQFSQVVQPDIKAFLRQRFQAICDPEPYDPDEHGYFILLEPGDTAEQIALATGYNPLQSLFDDSVCQSTSKIYHLSTPKSYQVVE